MFGIGDGGAPEAVAHLAISEDADSVTAGAEAGAVVGFDEVARGGGTLDGFEGAAGGALFAAEVHHPVADIDGEVGLAPLDRGDVEEAVGEVVGEKRAPVGAEFGFRAEVNTSKEEVLHVRGIRGAVGVGGERDELGLHAAPEGEFRDDLGCREHGGWSRGEEGVGLGAIDEPILDEHVE